MDVAPDSDLHSEPAQDSPPAIAALGRLAQGHRTRRRRRRMIRRLLWAELIKRSFDIDPLDCPNCPGRMKPIATLMDAAVVHAILESQGLQPEPPVVRPSRGPPGFSQVNWA